MGIVLTFAPSVNRSPGGCQYLLARAEKGDSIMRTSPTPPATEQAETKKHTRGGTNTPGL